VIFATIAFANIVIQSRPDLLPTAGIGTVFLLPAILLLGRLMGYKPPHVQDQSVLSLGLVALFVTFAHDRIASTRLFDWHADTEPYGLFVLICCLGYAATRRVLANERLLVSLGEEMRAATRILRHSPTSPARACPPFGLWPSRTGLDRQTKARWRSPGSRACCFLACAGS
jgi:hypothetical protein